MKLLWFSILYLTNRFDTVLTACNRIPMGATGERSPVDEHFQILIDRNPSTYIPGQQYNVSLSCPIKMKFLSFTLVVESENTETSSTYDLTGHFEILDAADTKFSSSCENMIESTNTNLKTRVNVSWVAPTNPESGCVLIKAGVLQHRDVWFIDDGFLTKRFCPEEIDEINSQTPPVNPCCACDEAKYEIVLERKWARNTHAKYFPSEAWRTRFSEIIGASHTFEYRFWQYGSSASQGLQEVAEHGATHTLEEEIKEHIYNGNVRTIIKAPGIGYRLNAIGTTLANARLDPKHHLISLVTKIDPSPDWILGISGLELCLINCTWIDRKVLNLYPWDIGTDAGPSYMSSDQQQKPPDVVRRITSTFPSDDRSPFFDKTGTPMKPLATLYITRKKLYIRECETVEITPLECATHPWNKWSDCSTRCGPGAQYRIRFYKNPTLAENYNCNMELKEERSCTGQQCSIMEDTEDNLKLSIKAECELNYWGPWSVCSKRCGKGFMIRTRNYKNPYAREKCQETAYRELEQTKECVGNDCGGSITEDQNIPNQSDDVNISHFFGKVASDFNQKNAYINNERQYDHSRDRTAIFEKLDQLDSLGNQNERYNSNYDNEKPQIPSINENHKVTSIKDNFISQQNVYGNDKLIVYDNRPTEQQVNKQNSYNTRYSSISKTLKSPQDKKRPLEHSDLNVWKNDFGNQRNRYKEFARKRTNQIIQEYCFDKPHVIKRFCVPRSEIIDRNYWFYDADDNECKLFTTDNCDENKNKFLTLESCKGTCANPQQMVEMATDDTNRKDNWNDQFGEPQSQRKERYSKIRRYNSHKMNY